MDYSVWLPADYYTSQRSYPVVYVLHGYSDDETGWIQFGEASRIAEKGIAEGKIPPCILVFPDGKVTWYCNSFDGKIAWKANNPLDLLHSVPLEKLKSVRFWIDCGDDDFLFYGNSMLHVEMRKLGIPHEYRVRDGGHTWSYWRTGLATGLEYIGEKFHR
jgi:enterochelin esterase-like enzyme